MTIADKIEQIGHLLSPHELAGLTGISRKTLYAKSKAGTIPTTRISGSVKYDPALIADWLREQTA